MTTDLPAQPLEYRSPPTGNEAVDGPAPVPRNTLIVFMALLVGAAVLNYLDRQAIATLGVTLKDKFKLSKEDWGLINSSFSLVYIFTSLLGGMWIDRVGVRLGLTISTLVWAVAAIGHASATGFTSLCIWRMMLALGEGPGAAAMVKGARRLMPPRLRDTGNGLINAGWAAGALLAPLVVGPIVFRFGWQASFIVTGGLCFLWLPVWLVATYTGARGPRASAVRANVHRRLGPQRLAIKAGSDEAPRALALRSWAVWGVLLAIFFCVPPTAFTNTFLPIYLNEARGLSQAQVATVYWQPFLATDAGQILGGLFVFALLRQGWRFINARSLVMVVGFLGSMAFLGVNYSPSLAGALASIDASRFFFQIGYTVLIAYGIESVAEHQTALMAGMTNAAFSACNMIFNPLMGRMVDHYHGYHGVIVLIAFFPLLGLAIWLLFSRLHARAVAAQTPPPTLEETIAPALDVKTESAS